MSETPKAPQTFPAPRTTAPILPPEEALQALHSPDLLLVDVRRTDYEGGIINGSLNLPAQSFYMNQGALLDLCKRAGVKKVLLPEQNRKDVRDLPVEVLEGLEIVHVRHIWEAMREIWPDASWPGERAWTGFESRL